MFEMVKFLDVVPLLLPSMVIKSAPFKVIIDVVLLLLMVAVTPLAGRTVILLVAEIPAKVEGKVMGNVSEADA